MSKPIFTLHNSGGEDTYCTNNFKIEPGTGTKSFSSEKGD
jgi:hypothetical protein